MFNLNSGEKELIAKYAIDTLAPLFNFQFSRFNDIPLLDREESLPFYNIPPAKDMASYSSTGTSGNPKKINWSSDEDLWYIAEKRKFILPFLEGCRRVFIMLGVGHGAFTSPEVFRDSSVEVFKEDMKDLDSLAKSIFKYAPDVFYCSPSLLVSLLKYLSEKGIKCNGTKRVILNGEVVHEGITRYFCDELSIEKKDILDTYGSTEVGTIAYTCNLCNKYHFLPGIIPETRLAADIPGSLPVQEDILILTSLKRTSFPVLRFVTYDLVRRLHRSVCKGVERYSYDRIIGRSDDVLNYGELFPAGDIIGLIKKYYPGRDYLIFNYHNDFDIVVEGKKNTGFETDILELYPSIKKLICNGLLEKYRIHYFDDLEAVKKEHMIQQSSTLKESCRIVKRRF